MTWEDIIKNESYLRNHRRPGEILDALNIIDAKMEKLFESFSEFMEDSPEKDGPYRKAQDLSIVAQKIREEINRLNNRIENLFVEYEKLYTENLL